LLDDIDAVHIRQAEIKDDKIGGVSADQVERSVRR